MQILKRAMSSPGSLYRATIYWSFLGFSPCFGRAVFKRATSCWTRASSAAHCNQHGQLLPTYMHGNEICAVLPANAAQFGLVNSSRDGFTRYKLC